jgi:hypothetical protein
MPTLAESPSLQARITDAVVSLLSAITALDSVTIRAADSSDAMQTPYIVVETVRTGEAIHNSGVAILDCTIKLNTTAHEGANATTDAELLAYDAAIEELLFKNSMATLAGTITAAANYATVYTCFDAGSQATEFSESKRNIQYQFTAHAIGLPEPEPDPEPTP